MQNLQTQISKESWGPGRKDAPHYHAGRVETHRVQMAYGNPAPPPTALAELERVSPPEEDPWCLCWGSRQSVLVGGRRLLAAQEKATTCLILSSLTSLMGRNLIVETGKFRSLEFIVLLRSSFFVAHAIFFSALPQQSNSMFA